MPRHAGSGHFGLRSKVLAKFGAKHEGQIVHGLKSSAFDKHQPSNLCKGVGRDSVESSCLQQGLSAMMETPKHRIRRNPSREPSPAPNPKKPRRRVVPQAGSHHHI